MKYMNGVACWSMVGTIIYNTWCKSLPNMAPWNKVKWLVRQFRLLCSILYQRCGGITLVRIYPEWGGIKEGIEGYFRDSWLGSYFVRELWMESYFLRDSWMSITVIREWHIPWIVNRVLFFLSIVNGSPPPMKWRHIFAFIYCLKCDNSVQRSALSSPPQLIIMYWYK